MSTTVDNRVVKMTFDNAQFEKGIKETIKSITDFESKLNFKGATAGFDKIKEATNKLNFGNLTKKSQEAASDLDKLGKSAENSFDKISKSADKVDLTKIAENADASFKKVSSSAEQVDFGRVGDKAEGIFSKITNAANNVDMSGIPSSAQNAINGVQYSVDSLNMNSIADKTSEASEGFNAFSVIATGALLEVGRQIEMFLSGGLNSLINGIKGLADKALFQPMKDGFQEYQTQIGAIQTIMANTSRDFHSAQDIADVNGALDTLNTYADKTIYNFTEMTRNIGTFTAAGVSMEDAVPSIQGIANLAALSGSNSEQASRAMYQLSQAMAAGTVKLMDWNSVVNAGMGGKVFQTKLLETAKHLHNVNAGFEDNATIMDDVINGNVSFRDSLEKGWITTDVLTEALIQMTYAENDMTAAEKASAIAHLESLGYTSEEIEAVFQLGQTAMESATKVRTWSQLWDTVGEALGSGWAQTWRTIIGDFQEATNLFTYLSQVITGVVGTVDNARNAIVDGWANFGGRDILFGVFTEDHMGRVVTVTNGVLQNLVDAITGWAKPVADAFSSVFQIFGDNGPDPSTYDADYARALKAGAEEAEQYRQQYLQPFVERFGENSQEVADQVNNLNRTLDMFNNHAFDNVLDPNEYDADYARALKVGAEEAEQYRQEYLEPFIEQFGEDSEEVAAQVEVLNHTADLYNQHKFDNIDPKTLLLDDVALEFVDLTNRIKEFTATLIPTDTAMDGLRGIFEGLFAAIRMVITIVGTLIDVFGSAIEIVRIFTDPFVDLVLYIGGSAFKIFGQLCDYVVEIVHAFNDFFHSVVDRVKPALKGVVDGFLGWLDIPGKIEIVIRFISDFLEAIWKIVDVPGKIRAAKDAFGGVFDSIKNFLFGTQESAEGAGDAVEGLVPKISNYFGRIKDAIYNAFPFIKDFVDKIKNFYNIMEGNDDPNGEKRKLYIERLVNDFKNSIKDAWQPIQNLIGALGNFAGKIVEFVGNLQPVKDAIGIFNGLKDSFVNFVNSIPDKIKSFGPQVKGEAEEAASGFDAFKKIQEIADYFNNVTVEQFIADAQKFKDEFVGRITGAFEAIKNIKIGDISRTLNIGIWKSFEAFSNIGDFIKNTLIGIFPKSEEAINAGWTGIRQTMLDGAIGAMSIVNRAFNESETVPQFVVNLFKGVGEAISNGVNNTVQSIRNTDFGAIANGIKDKLNGMEMGFFIFGKNVANALKATFPESADVIMGAWSNIYNVTMGGFAKVREAVDNAKNESSTFPEFIVNLFKNISGIINEGIANIVKEIGNIKLSDILGLILKPLEMFRDFLKENFPNLSGVVDTLVNSLSGFKGHLDEAGTTIGEVVSQGFKNLLSTLESIAPQAMSWIENLGKAFTGLPDGIVKGLKWASSALSHLPGFLGSIFGGISKLLTGYTIATKANAEEMPEAYGQMFEGAQTEPQEAGNILQEFFSKFDPSNIAKSLRDMGGFVVEHLKDSFTKIKEYLQTLPDKLKSIIDEIAAKTNNFQDIIDAVKQIIEGYVLVQIGNFVKNIGSAINNYTKYLKGKETNDFSEKMKNIGIAIAAVGAVVAILSQIKQEDLDKGINTVIAIGSLLTAMEIIPALVEKFAKIEDISAGGSGIMKAAIGILVVSIAMKILLSAIKEFDSTNIGDLAEGFVRIVIAVAGLLFVMKKLGTADTMSAGIGLMALSIAMLLMVPAIKGLSDALNDAEGNFNDQKAASLGASLLAIAGLIVAFGTLAQATNEMDLVGTGLGMIAFSVGIMMISQAISAIVSNVDNVEKLNSAAWALILMVGVLTLFTTATEGLDVIATAAGLIIFSVAIGVLSASLMVLSATCKPEMLIASAIALGLLVLSLGGLAAMTSEVDLVATAASILIFSAALIAISIALTLLAQCNPDAIWAAAGGMAVLLGVFGAVGFALSTVGPIAIGVLVALAAAFAAVGIAAYLIAQGINIVVDAFLRMAESSQTIETFVQTIANNLQNFLTAAGAFAAIGAGMFVLALGMGALGLALGGFGVACSFAAGGIGLLNLALNAFLDIAARAQGFSEAGNNITAGIGQGISSGVGWVVQAITGIGQTILSTILGFFGIHSPSDLMADEVGQFIPAGIAEGIDLNAGSMIDSLGSGLEELLGKFSTWVETEGLPKLQEFGNGLLDKLKNEILPNISNWVKTEGIPMLKNLAAEAVQGLFGEANKLPPKLLEMATGIPANVWEGIHQGWDNFIRAGADIVNGIVEGIKSVPNAIGNALNNVSQGAFNGVVDFFQISSPSKLMKEQVGKYIPLGLAAGINKYAEIAVDSAVAMAESTTNGISDNLATDMFDEMSAPTIPAPVVEPFDIYDELGEIPSPHIKPIVDMDNTWDDLKSYVDTFNGINLQTTQTNLQNINADLNLGSFDEQLIAQSNQLSSLTSQNEKLVNELNRLRSDMAAYTDAINNSAIVMDSGALVGSITTKMDKALGRRQSLASRGVF